MVMIIEQFIMPSNAGPGDRHAFLCDDGRRVVIRLPDYPPGAAITVRVPGPETLEASADATAADQQYVDPPACESEATATASSSRRRSVLDIQGQKDTAQRMAALYSTFDERTGKSSGRRRKAAASLGDWPLGPLTPHAGASAAIAPTAAAASAAACQIPCSVLLLPDESSHDRRSTPPVPPLAAANMPHPPSLERGASSSVASGEIGLARTGEKQQQRLQMLSRQNALATQRQEAEARLSLLEPSRSDEGSAAQVAQMDAEDLSTTTKQALPEKPAMLCEQLLERDGGRFGCRLPAGHSGPHHDCFALHGEGNVDDDGDGTDGHGWGGSHGGGAAMRAGHFTRTKRGAPAPKWGRGGVPKRPPKNCRHSRPSDGLTEPLTAALVTTHPHQASARPPSPVPPHSTHPVLPQPTERRSAPSRSGRRLNAFGQPTRRRGDGRNGGGRATSTASRSTLIFRAQSEGYPNRVRWYEGVELIWSNKGTTGYKGVSKNSSCPDASLFSAQSTTGGVSVLGRFASAEEAALCYAKHTRSQEDREAEDGGDSMALFGNAVNDDRPARQAPAGFAPAGRRRCDEAGF